MATLATISGVRIIEGKTSTAMTVEAFVKSVTREFILIGASSRIQARDVMAAFGITYNTVYSDRDNKGLGDLMRAKTLSFEPDGEEIAGGLGDYLAKISYENLRLSTNSSGDNVEIITDGPAAWSVEYSLEEAETDVDRFGAPIKLTSGQLVKGLTKPVVKETQIATFIRSGHTWEGAVASTRGFIGKCNADAYKSAAARELLCVGFLPTALDDAVFAGGGNVKYTFRMTYIDSRVMDTQAGLLVVPGWTRSVFNASTVEKNPLFDAADPSKGEPLRPVWIDKKRGIQANEPVLLNADGQRADPGDKPIVIQAELIDQIDFGGLGI